MPFKKYFKVWYLTASNALQETFVNRWTNSLFIFGKAVRLGMTLLFLFLIRENIQTFAGYSPDQLIVFFLTYQFIDTFSQILFRGVYQFGNLVKSGEFDFLLSKPINPLFRALTGNPDINDALFFIPTTLISIYIVMQLAVTITFQSILLFIALLVNGMIVVTGLHILVLSAAILTTEVDGVVWMYRDLLRLGQFPTTIYFQLIRWTLFFLVPIGIVITIPAQILTNTDPSIPLLGAFAIGIGFFLVSREIWKVSLRRYGSASS